MRYIRYTNAKPPNPFVQALSLVAAAGLLVLSVILGAIVLAGLVGFVLLALLAVYARLWWLRRKLDATAARRRRQDEDVVEAEYRVIDISNRHDEQ